MSFKRCHQPRGAAGIAAASAAICSYYLNGQKEQTEDTRAYNHHIFAKGSQARNECYPFVQSNVTLWISTTPFNRVSALTANCEASLNASLKKSTTIDDKQAATSTNNEDAPSSDFSKIQLDYYYIKLEPHDIERTSLLDSHAVFGALSGEGLIERYNVYKHVILNNKNDGGSLLENKREMVVVDLKLGSRLNGHGGIAHGGILSLLFDEAMGWAYECLHEQDDTIDPSSHTAVTANLTVDFRAPFMEGSEGVIRVYHDETKGRKIYFTAVLESHDGSVVFAEAKSLFILVRSDRLKVA